MSERNRNRSVNVWALLGSVTAVLVAAFLVILAGGPGTSSIVLLAIPPLLAWRLGGQAIGRAVLLTALVGCAGLGMLQLFGAMPPAMGALESMMTWLAPVLLMACALGFFIGPRRVAGPETPPDMPDIPVLDLPAHGPLLVVDVSPLGRVRHAYGATGLFPGIEEGRVAERVFLDAEGYGARPGALTTQSGARVFCHVSTSEAGEVWTFIEGLETGTDQLEALAQQLRERTDFFASLGHDLKSPLNAVIGFADMMDAEMLGPMPEKYKDYPGLIKESGSTLLRLVEDMLGYARSEAGTYEIDLAPLDVTASAEAIMRQSQAEAARADVSLELKAPGEVLAMADAGAVQRIWDNLVSNAIKYSPSGSRITLSVRQRGNKVAISVTDRGAGMDAEDLARIARPFEQGRNAKGRAGTGLGLAMVQRLAEMHHGQMVIRTAPGEGTQVTVNLPAAQRSSRNAAE